MKVAPLGPLLRARAPWMSPRPAPTVMYGFTGFLECEIGSGTDLYRTEPVFRASVDAMSALMAPWAGVEIADAFADPAGESATELAGQYFGSRRYQVVLQIGLTDLWAARGLRPGAVIGLCLGEYVGAYAAGILDHRGAAHSLEAMFHHLEAARSPGMLWIVEATAHELGPVLADAPVTMHLVGSMARREAVVVCASVDADRGRDHLRRTTTVRSEHPGQDLSWHTRMPPVADAEFLNELSNLTCRPAACPFYPSSLAGARIDRGVAPDARFFTEIVQLGSAFDVCAIAAIADGHRLILTVSPTIARLIDESIDEEDRRAVHAIHSFECGKPALEVLARADHELRSLRALR